jgi:hypothetical protein
MKIGRDKESSVSNSIQAQFTLALETPLVAPLFYGMAAFNFATANGARALPVQNASSTGAVRCWAVLDSTGARRVVLVNRDATPGAGAVAVTLQRSAPLSGSATVAAPVTALFAFVDPGLAEDANCGQLIAGAR